MIPQTILTAPRDNRRERAWLLYCPDQGGWQSGVWFDSRWTDFGTMTMDLEPTFWAEPPADNFEPEPGFASHLRF